MRHAGVEVHSEYAGCPRGGVFPSKLDVASSSLVSRSIAFEGRIRIPIISAFETAQGSRPSPIHEKRQPVLQWWGDLGSLWPPPTASSVPPSESGHPSPTAQRRLVSWPRPQARQPCPDAYDLDDGSSHRIDRGNAEALFSRLVH